jgi:hypothetical protein
MSLLRKNLRECPNCGATVTPFAAGCAVCGTTLDPKRFDSAGSGVKNWRPTNLQAAIAGGVALVLLIVVVVSSSSGVESYTCADIAASSEKTAEVDARFEQQTAEILGLPERSVNLMATIFGSQTDADCAAAKPDDKVWPFLQAYLDELQSSKDAEAAQRLKIFEDNVSTQIYEQTGNKVQSVSCDEFPDPGRETQCDITAEDGQSASFGVKWRSENDKMIVTLNLPG